MKAGDEITGKNEAMPWIQEIQVPLALISYLYRTLQKKFTQELASYNLGWGHFAILMAVYEQEGRSQDDIALSRGFDKTMIAKSVIKLEEEGLIYRQIDSNDKRMKRLYITELGLSQKDEIRQIGYNLSKSLLKDFPEEDVAKALEYMRKMALNASEM